MVVRMKCCVYPNKISGSFTAPLSKSETHRALICAYLGGSRVKNPAVCTDTELTEKALENLERGGKIHCGQSGSTLRLLLPVAAAKGISAQFICNSSLIKRPVSPLLDALCANGITAGICGNEIQISGKLRAGRFVLPGDISSQFVSGLLFACPLLNAESEIVINGSLQSEGYADMTLGFLKKCAVECEKTENGYRVKNGGYDVKNDFVIGGDWSGASALLAAGILGGGAECLGLDSQSAQPISSLHILPANSARVLHYIIIV